MSFFVYLLRCRDSSLYCGYTTDLEKRVAAHNSGKASKYTSRKRPVYLVYKEELPSLSAALKREYAIKQFSKIEKESLVKRD